MEDRLRGPEAEDGKEQVEVDQVGRDVGIATERAGNGVPFYATVHRIALPKSIVGHLSMLQTVAANVFA